MGKFRAEERAQMWPQLSAGQIERLRRHGDEVTIPGGTQIFEAGDDGVPFYVVLEGEIEVVHPRGDHEEPITVHRKWQFTGEINLLTGRRTLIRGRTRVDTIVLRVEIPRLQDIIQRDSDLSDILMRAFILRRMGMLSAHYGDVVVGSRHSADTTRVQEFLTRNGHPYNYLDVDADPDVQYMLERFKVKVTEVPVLICQSSRVLKNPTNAEIAECLGLNSSIDICTIHDLVIVGAGPAGLAAAVYAASEGLDVLVIESTAPGGQAGSSSKIENYLGFPTGISGQMLAQRALSQAEKFGARVSIARGAVGIMCDFRPYSVLIEGGDPIWAKSIVIATGAKYRKLDVPNLSQFEGTGIHYGATFLEAKRCNGDVVAVVGGGNSAGQAATFLSETAAHVHMLIRAQNLASSMSQYLIKRIEETPNITLRPNTQIVEMMGDSHLEQVTWKGPEGRTTLRIRHVFSMTGAKPNTDWLCGCIELDQNGFVVTGIDLKNPQFDRPPLPYETSRKGIFAIGDVRANSVKRVASGVGEGAACVQHVHRVLAEGA